MELTPPAYPCPVHQTDLTEQVKDALLNEPVLIFRRPKRNGGERFTVIVSCPGDGDYPEAHRLQCSGTFIR